MSDVECPHCFHEIEICTDDGFGTDESETYEQKCPHCESTFALRVCISLTYSASKADCMNGGEHNFRVNKKNPWNIGKELCMDCGKEITTDQAAYTKAMAEYFASLKSRETKP